MPRWSCAGWLITTTEIVVINSTDYVLYLPLMPQVAGGLVEPRHIRASLLRRLRKTRFVLGTVNRAGPRQKVVSWAGPEGASGQVGYDRLILTVGSVDKLRQGRQVARNVAASLGTGEAKPYKHRDLGFVVDLGGLAAAANPLHIPLSGPPANAVTRSYHLFTMPGNGRGS